MIRILVQPRDNFFELRGGDNVQLEKTLAHLADLGIEADISVSPTPDLARYDLVHIFNLGDGCGEIRYLVNARRQHKPVVLSPIYWNPERIMRYQLDRVPPPVDPETRRVVARVNELRHESERIARRLLLSCASQILTLSQAEGRLLARDFGAPTERVRVVHNGVESFFAEADPSVFARRYGLRDFVLCAARVSVQKNQLNLVRAWRDEAIPLVLIGNPEDAAYAAECHTASGRNTIWIGPLAREELASAYAAAHVHALVSWYEMMPLAALEAGMAGCNLVLTTETAGPEFFDDGVWYCDPEDLEGIRTAIRAAHAAPRTGNLGASIRQRFTWEGAAAATAEAYREAIATYPERELNEAAYAACLEALVSQLDDLARYQGELARLLWLESLKISEFMQRIERGRAMRALKWGHSLLRRFSSRKAPE